MFNRAPLSSTYMLVSMLGFIFSAFLINLLPSWAFAFLIVFVIMFVASLITMSNIPFDDEVALEELKIHDKLHYHKKRNRKK